MGNTGTNTFLYKLSNRMSVCVGCVYYGYHGYQHVFVLNLNISAVLSRVPMGTKSQGVMRFCINSPTECVCGWVEVYNGYHGYQRVFV